METQFVDPLPNDPESLIDRERRLPQFFRIREDFEDFLEKSFQDQTLALLRGDVPFLDGPRQLTRDEFYRINRHHKLPARISDLRKRGHVIDGPLVEAPTGRSRIKDYRLQHDDERGINYIWEDGE